MKNKMKLTVLTAIVVSISCLTGCASIVDGTQQPVDVKTTPVKNADCTLSNSKGKWHLDKTPGSVNVHRAYGPLDIKCQKKGYKPVEKKVKSHTKGMAFGNLIFGGAIGAGVDVASGAAYDYPQSVVIPMQREKA